MYYNVAYKNQIYIINGLRSESRINQINSTLLDVYVSFSSEEESRTACQWSRKLSAHNLILRLTQPFRCPNLSLTQPNLLQCSGWFLMTKHKRKALQGIYKTTANFWETVFKAVWNNYLKNWQRKLDWTGVEPETSRLPYQCFTIWAIWPLDGGPPE
jgi:hypothetical protein